MHPTRSAWPPGLYAHAGAAVHAAAAAPFDTWQRGTGAFTVHAQGFPIFLSAEDAAALDEYAEADPYAPEGQGQSAFWRWRLDVCGRLLSEAVAGGSPERVLDLGCGRADMLAALAERFPATRFVGLDGSMAAISGADALPPNVDVCVGDALRPPFLPGAFDGVLMMNLWEHVTDPIAMARAARGLLRPGGWLLVSTPSRFRLENLVRALRGKDMALRSRQHVTEYTVGQVVEQLRCAGFEVERVVGDDMPRGTGAGRLRGAAVRALLGAWKQLTGSHHAFGPTVFFLARPVPVDAGPQRASPSTSARRSPHP